MAVVVFNRKNKPVTLLNPKEKVRKFTTEVKHDVRLTNDGVAKTDRRGKMIGLTDEQKAYRAGYRECYKDCAKAHYSKQNKRSKSTRKSSKK